ncbi:MAG: type II secretion system protein [Actinomycetales bacterium]|nr:type II secretion system protein [Actinomycetales bacterium]
MTRIASALRARLEDVKKNEQGFTLIELLVVVIIIGILAAIAIPVFIGVQNNAKDASVKSDLGNAKTAVVAYFTANPTGTVAADGTTKTGTSALSDYGFTATSGNQFNFGSSVTSTSFCITGKGETGNYFNVTANGAVGDGACTGVTIP